MRIDVEKCASVLKEQSNILILTHAHPDGDTLGCGFALCHALLGLGKNARVVNADEIPEKYNYLYKDADFPEFAEEFIVAVDVATENLLGGFSDVYSGRINLCIDHHGTNTDYAEYLLLEETAAACEIVYKVIKALGAEITPLIANCLYTGISTDTGCFRYASATSSTYHIAAELIDCGADNGFINRVMFETKTKSYAMLEKLALEGMELYCNDRVAVIKLTQEMYCRTGSNEQETEAIPPLTRQIEGVEIGITIREKPDKTCKASFRTFETVNAAELAKAFGGGGHKQAAACRFEAGVNEAEAMIVAKCRELLQ